MNRRGAVIAIYLTVVVAIVLSALALFNFLNHGDVFGKRTQNNEYVIEQQISMHNYIESVAKISMKESSNKGFTKEAIIDSVYKHDLKLYGQGNFFDKIKNGEFEIIEKNGNKLLKVEGILIYSQSDRSSIKRVFDLEIETDSNGEFIRFINN